MRLLERHVCLRGSALRKTLTVSRERSRTWRSCRRKSVLYQYCILSKANETYLSQRLDAVRTLAAVSERHLPLPTYCVMGLPLSSRDTRRHGVQVLGIAPGFVSNSLADRRSEPERT